MSHFGRLFRIRYKSIPMRTFTAACLSIFLLISLAACKKERDEAPAHTLVGQWYETNLTGLVRSLQFTNDNKFGFTSGDQAGNATRYFGTYELRGDSMKVAITEKVTQEAGKPSVKTPSNQALYEKATFKVSVDTLTLKYITYPADAPVITTVKFQRAIRID